MLERLRRILRRPAAPEALRPRRTGGPVLRLYTLAGQDLSDAARASLAGLRDALGFEVEETVLSEGTGGPEGALAEHAPVAFLDGERIFSYAIDPHVLAVKLARRAGREGEGR